MNPTHLKYTKDHEWALVADGVASIGITNFAQEQLGDIVFVDLPQRGGHCRAGEPFGTVESIKSVSDLYAPLSGEILAVNTDLSDQPELLNADPYAHWIIKVKIGEPAELENLLNAGDYQKYEEN